MIGHILGRYEIRLSLYRHPGVLSVPDTRSSWQTLLAELKRRRVYRIGAAYAAAAFVTLEAADIIFPALGLPPWVFTALVLATLAGFPIALTLAWAYELTPHGLRRTGHVAHARLKLSARLVALGAVTLLAVAAVYPVFLKGGVWSHLDPNVVMVAPFENMRDEPELDAVGTQIAIRVTDAVSRIGTIRVVFAPDALGSSSALRDAGVSLTDLAGARALAQESGANAGTVVLGSYARRGGSLDVDARIIDARSGQTLSTIGPVTVPADIAVTDIDELTEEITVALASRFEPAYEWVRGASQERPNAAAYREYVQGLELYSRLEGGALDHLLEAARLDTTFLQPLLFASLVLKDMARQSSADSLLEVLNQSRHRLSPSERHFLDAQRAMLRRDRQAFYEFARMHHERSPGALPRFGMALSAFSLHRVREAVAHLEKIDPERGLRGWGWPYWFMRTHGLHVLGEHDRELEAAEAGRRQYPERAMEMAFEVKALAALGRLKDLRARLDESLSFRERWLSAADVMETAAMELRVHGRPGEAQPLLERAAAWYEGRSAEEKSRWRYRRDYGRVLYAMGRYERAAELFEGLAAQYPDGRGFVHYKGFLGVIAARQGDETKAREISDELGSIERDWMYGANTYWRACIAAVLGERDRAMTLLRRAIEKGFDHPIWPYHAKWQLHTDIDFDGMRDYAPFQELLRPKD